MASKKNEDTKKGAASKAVAPARKGAAATKAAAARNAAPSKKVPASKAPAKKAAPTKKAASLPAKVEQDCCLELTRKVDSLRKELREALKALRAAGESRRAPAQRSLDASVINTLQFLLMQQVTVAGEEVTFALPGNEVTLTAMARDHGMLRLELRPGGTGEQPLALPRELQGILAGLFGFLIDNANYVSAVGIAATCGDEDC